jgi:dihydroxyacetone kinase
VRKIINDPNDFVDEVVEGILAAHPRMLKAVTPDRRALARADAPIAGHVGIVTGGGSGHLPLFLGYVGVGLCTAVAVGNVFSSPSSEQILAATRAAHGGAGVLYLYGNYGGDVMNFDLAGELAVDEGIQTETVLGTDDVASAPPSRADERRGVAGLFFAYKCAGAAAEQGRPLKDVAAIAQAAVTNTAVDGRRSVADDPPAAGKPTFELGPDEMEIGIGIHGERGVRRGRLETADRIAEDLLGKIREDLALSRGDEIGGADQWPRRDAAGGALRPLSICEPEPGGNGRSRTPALRRRVRHEPRDGRCVPQRHASHA